MAVSSKPPKFRRKLFISAIRYLHDKGEFSPGMLHDKPLAKLRDETVRCLDSAIDTTLKSSKMPEAMVSMLREDVFIFSGCKTYHELREASQLLLDDRGNLKPFYKFKLDVLNIYPKYNEQYLEAEHAFAVNSAQSAAQWAEWQADGDEYDLQYSTAGDNLVRETHAALEGITLPPSDPFWKSYMTPNGWNCRCRVKQVLRGKNKRTDTAMAEELGRQATTQIDAKGRNAAEMFRFNPGAQNVVFPPTHPYYHNAPEEAKTRSDER